MTIETPILHINKSLNVSTCIPVLTPQGPIQHLKALMGKLTQIECQSHKESTVPSAELGVLTQHNWVLQLGFKKVCLAQVGVKKSVSCSGLKSKM